MNRPALQRYKAARAAGASVSIAIAQARYRAPRPIVEYFDMDKWHNVRAAPGYVGRIRLAYEECPDWSHVGDFKWERGSVPAERLHGIGRDPDAIPVETDRGSVCIFRPMSKFAEILAYYRRHMARGPAYERAWEQVRSQYEEAQRIVRNDTCQVWMRAEVCARAAPGVVLGDASLGGIEVDTLRDPYLQECARDLLAEAVNAARKTRAKLCCKAAA